MILIDQFYLHGGIEKLVSIKANYWSEQMNYNVIIVSTEQHEHSHIYSISTKIKFIDLDINYQRGISFFHPKNLTKLISNFNRLKQVIKNNQPDLILVASHIPMTYLLPFIKTNAKIAKEFHFSKHSKSTSIKTRFFEKIENKYDYLIVLSKEESKFYNSNNVVVIPNPIQFSKEVMKEEVQNKAKIAGAVLRFAPVKQLDKMISAWDLFYQNNKDWKLYIYGDTKETYFNEIRIMVLEKNLQNSVVFKGMTSEVDKALDEIAVLLMTSANECFPMVILEANACGVPVVSFDSPTGPRNIINHDVDGVIVPLNDINSFAQQLGLLVNDEDNLLKMSMNAVENSRLYQLDNVMQLWEIKIFNKL